MKFPETFVSPLTEDQIKLLKKKLIESANSFDSKGLNSIILELREMKENDSWE